ncbi:hypothetical protein C8046_13075 [Serinibacter arcticus]|uniref:Uncharacterized protein n=1 Tax=Serinibacter arcticus TaxID=1655435 RepID=A0A2U1ZWY2_9MICO|nr:hypothetical protein [Serinibacter arcticus]PWD51450.1 hypothetical protein C8046_13075 [Serinibacter arcticus]
MSTIHISDTTTRQGRNETETAALAVGDTVEAILAGQLPDAASVLRRPLPIAFLDDGRRLFLVVDATRGHGLDTPRSWGVEVVTDGDLVGEAPGAQVAVRSTQRLTPEGAAAAALYVLGATR